MRPILEYGALSPVRHLWNEVRMITGCVRRFFKATLSSFHVLFLCFSTTKDDVAYTEFKTMSAYLTPFFQTHKSCQLCLTPQTKNIPAFLRPSPTVMEVEGVQKHTKRRPQSRRHRLGCSRCWTADRSTGRWVCI